MATVEYMVCNDGQCLPPEYKDLEFVLSDTIPSAQQDENSNQNELTVSIEDKVLTTSNTTPQRGLWSIFIIAFFSGFAALLTPCVFPMIPMTVSFFTKQSKTRAKGIKNAILYGISIIVIYVLLGSLITGIFGADSLNALSTNVWFNLLFFLLLLVFAASFLGAFEIMLSQLMGQ